MSVVNILRPWPKDAILALGKYRCCVECWIGIAADKRRPEDERLLARLYLAWVFEVDLSEIEPPIRKGGTT